MNETSTVLGAVIPVFGIAGVGFAIRKLNWLTEQADQSLLRVTVNVLLPCLILDTALGNPALAHAGNLLLPPLVGFGTTTLGIFLALMARPLHGLTDLRARRTFALSTGMYNYGYVPLPLAMMLFDNETVGVLLVHNVGVEICLWTVGVMLLGGVSLKRDWRKTVNGPVVAVLLVVVLNALGGHGHVPDVVHTLLHWLGQCTIPLALILTGAIIADHIAEFHSAHGWRVIGSAVLLRTGIFPCFFLLLARYIPASVELKRVIVLQAAMPSAVFPIILAKHYKGDPPTAVRVVLATTAISLVTIPLWIRFGMKFVGL